MLRRNTNIFDKTTQLNNIIRNIQEGINSYDKKHSVNEEVNFEEGNDEPEVEPETKLDISDNIKQIRKICLSSINDLSDEVDSDEYDSFKKVLDICDSLLRKKFNKK